MQAPITPPPQITTRMMSPAIPTEAPGQPRSGSLATRSPGHQFDGWLAEVLVARSVNRWLRFGASLNRGQTPEDIAPKDRSYRRIDGEARRH